MLESVELRWFYEDHSPLNLDKIFKSSKIQTNYEIRSDYYLLIKNCDYIGIKLRNSRLEIKWRNYDQLFDLPKLNISGKIEHWIRWEWNDINPFKDIVQFLQVNKVNPWVKIDKKRFQKKFNIQNKLLVEVTSNEQSSDFAIEITELKVNNQLWWSVGFDSFTSCNKITFLKQIIETQLMDQFQINLQVEQSYGYPKWLSKVFKN